MVERVHGLVVVIPQRRILHSSMPVEARGIPRNIGSQKVATHGRDVAHGNAGMP